MPGIGAPAGACLHASSPPRPDGHTRRSGDTWLLVVYVGSLLLLVVTAFFKLDTATQKPTSELTLDNIDVAFTTSEFTWTVIPGIGVAGPA